MRNTVLILFIIITSFFEKVVAQPAERRTTREEYIEIYKDHAIQEMQRTGIPASITLAQGILESGDGNSPLAIYANNHFGVKCHNDWEGDIMRFDDDQKDECFRKYESAYDSYHDHSEFLTGRSRYKSLFDLKITDYKGWSKGLKKAGYATNPKYADLLISLIEQHELDKYDSYAKVRSKKLKKLRNSRMLASAKKSRLIRLRNNIKYIRVREGDTFLKLSRIYKMNLWQIYRYNDLNKKDVLRVGDIIYLQPKRNNSVEDFHIARKSETMRDISQMYGVKLKKLYKKNNMIIGTQPNPGDKVYLRRKKSKSKRFSY